MPIKNSMLLVACLLAGRLLGQNCTTTIAFPADTVLCSPGSVELAPQVSGDFLDFSWSPVTNLNNPLSLNPIATITSSETYTLAVRSLGETELIFNGDFSQGDTGFTSDYIYGTGGGVGLLSNGGQYAIADDAGDTHNQFAHCNDHTGGGNMMVVNASGDLSNLWCQTIAVSTNTDYAFTAWVTSVTSQNPAQLQFSINGTLLDEPYNASPATCNWQSFTAEWNAGNTTTAEICIVNSNLTPAGNDFALDDISFREICTATADYTIDLADLQAELEVPASICQGQPIVPLSTFLGVGSTPGGNWFLNGEPITSLNPNALALGLFTISYNLTLGPCELTAASDFEVLAAPEAGQASSAEICGEEVTNFDLNEALFGNDLTGAWSPVAGNPPGGALVGNLFTPGEPGLYAFHFIVPGQGACPADTATLEITVHPSPVADLPATLTLDCFDPTGTLAGPNTTQGPNILYTWYQDGMPLFDNNLPELLVTEAGDYRLEVLDQGSGCQASADASVISEVADISFTLTANPADCQAPNNGSITVDNLQGGSEPYLYSLNGGPFTDDPQLISLPPGLYTVLIQDAAGCEAGAEVELPTPEEPAIMLTAQPDEVALGESVTLRLVMANGQPDSIIWQPAPDDCDNCPQWRDQPTENTEYRVTVVDENGCTATATASVRVRPESNIFFPNALSPNGDGTNDRFSIFDGGVIDQIITLRIFDRWGNLLYEDLQTKPNDLGSGWDGKAGGRAVSAGVYVFQAEIRLTNGEIRQFSGEVNVVY